MNTLSRPPRFGETHDVFNQSAAARRLRHVFEPIRRSSPRSRAKARNGMQKRSRATAVALTQPDVLALADLANRHSPELHTHDARGERIDAIEFHPAWHDTARALAARGAPRAAVRGGASGKGGRDGRALRRLFPARPTRIRLAVSAHDDFRQHSGAAKGAGTLRDPARALLSREHDPRDIPLAQASVRSVGMGMTEKQGGSDVRSNRPRPRDRHAGRGGEYRLIGHKWFFSAPQCDAHLVLRARAKARALVLLRAALSPRTAAGTRAGAAPEGQARQPVEREQRGRVLDALRRA